MPGQEMIPGQVRSHMLQGRPGTAKYIHTYIHKENMGFPGSSAVKNLPANAKDAGLIPGLGRPPGEGIGNPLQYSFLGNPMDGGVWWATVHGVAKEADLTTKLMTKQQQ